ncbi:MAG: SDR family oxidoreductase [Alphaproteobacteria bacterium]|nr:SDR family oxidoreductase [Alphaproteobacteria bacterium]
MTLPSDRKTIFITGAGSGIGRATAKLFAERGWFVGLYDISAEGLVATQKLLPEGRHTSGVLDVRDREAWRNAVGQFADATRGRLNVLFNNAGVGRHGWFEDIAHDDSDWQIDVNLKGVVNGVYAALPLLRKTPGARIVNTASAAGLVGSPQLAVYSATKFAVRGLSEALDVEFSRYGVRVTCLMPSFIETPILDMPTGGRNTVLRDQIKATNAEVEPVEVAAEAAWKAAHGEAVHYTAGRMAQRLRTAARFFPNGLRKQLIASLPKD